MIRSMPWTGVTTREPFRSTHAPTAEARGGRGDRVESQKLDTSTERRGTVDPSKASGADATPWVGPDMARQGRRRCGRIWPWWGRSAGGIGAPIARNLCLEAENKRREEKRERKREGRRGKAEEVFFYAFFYNIK